MPTVDEPPQTVLYESDIVNFNNLSLFNVSVFDKKLQGLPGFEGFAPRYTLITRLRNLTDSLLNTSAMLVVIDSKREIDIGLGRYFSQKVMGKGDIMVSN